MRSIHTPSRQFFIAECPLYRLPDTTKPWVSHYVPPEARFLFGSRHSCVPCCGTLSSMVLSGSCGEGTLRLIPRNSFLKALPEDVSRPPWPTPAGGPCRPSGSTDRQTACLSNARKEIEEFDKGMQALWVHSQAPLESVCRVVCSCCRDEDSIHQSLADAAEINERCDRVDCPQSRDPCRWTGLRVLMSPKQT